jgi:hypothetical protein
VNTLTEQAIFVPERGIGCGHCWVMAAVAAFVAHSQRAGRGTPDDEEIAAALAAAATQHALQGSEHLRNGDNEH